MKYRHGDVLIKSAKVKGKKVNHLRLAEGESTGHCHQITEGDAELYEHEGTLFLKVNSEIAKVTHEEHKVIEIKKGEYEITIQREYIPGSWEKVVD